MLRKLLNGPEGSQHTSQEFTFVHVTEISGYTGSDMGTSHHVTFHTELWKRRLVSLETFSYFFCSALYGVTLITLCCALESSLCDATVKLKRHDVQLIFGL